MENITNNGYGASLNQDMVASTNLTMRLWDVQLVNSFFMQLRGVSVSKVLTLHFPPSMT